MRQSRYPLTTCNCSWYQLIQLELIRLWSSNIQTTQGSMFWKFYVWCLLRISIDVRLALIGSKRSGSMTARNKTTSFSGRKLILIKSSYYQETQGSFVYFILKTNSTHLIKNEMSPCRFSLSLTRFTDEKIYMYYAYRILIIRSEWPLLLKTLYCGG